MEKTLLNKLMQSLKEAKAISQGKAMPSRRFLVSPSNAKAAHDFVIQHSARARAILNQR